METFEPAENGNPQSAAWTIDELEDFLRTALPLKETLEAHGFSMGSIFQRVLPVLRRLRQGEAPSEEDQNVLEETRNFPIQRWRHLASLASVMGRPTQEEIPWRLSPEERGGENQETLWSLRRVADLPTLPVVRRTQPRPSRPNVVEMVNLPPVVEDSRPRRTAADIAAEIEGRREAAQRAILEKLVELSPFRRVSLEVPRR